MTDKIWEAIKDLKKTRNFSQFREFMKENKVFSFVKISPEGDQLGLGRFSCPVREEGKTSFLLLMFGDNETAQSAMEHALEELPDNAGSRLVSL
jgi:hypothetical protein